mgnify:CR=1 FL=1
MENLTIQQLIADYGYWALFAGTFMEGETFFLLGGIAARQGMLSPWGVALAALAGGFVGDQVFFLLGKWRGVELLSSSRRLARKAVKVRSLVRRHALALMLLSRFLYGFRMVIPLACGTSGMKAALNGGLNLSILDGWWAEAFNPECGWAIGTGAEGGDPGYQDAVESQALYNILENDVIPAFYDRLAGDAPSRWSTMMKSSMKLAMEHFCSLRMVEEYSARYYMPAAARFDELVADNARKARDLAVQHERIRSLWNRIRIEQPRRNVGGPMRVGEAFTAGTVVHLGELRPDEVDVHLYYGRMMALDAVASSRFVPMAVAKDLGGGSYRYECTVICDAAGRYGFTARVVPRGDQWIQNTPGLLTWADAVD